MIQPPVYVVERRDNAWVVVYVSAFIGRVDVLTFGPDAAQRATDAAERFNGYLHD